jgi:hypothetical protein
LIRRFEVASEPLAIPIVAAEEQCKGWLAKIARTRDIHQQIAPYERLAELFDFLAEWDINSLRRNGGDFQVLRTDSDSLAAQLDKEIGGRLDEGRGRGEEITRRGRASGVSQASLRREPGEIRNECRVAPIPMFPPPRFRDLAANPAICGVSTPS